jgi:hypothetical protein
VCAEHRQPEKRLTTAATEVGFAAGYELGLVRKLFEAFGSCRNKYRMLASLSGSQRRMDRVTHL